MDRYDNRDLIFMATKAPIEDVKRWLTENGAKFPADIAPSKLRQRMMQRIRRTTIGDMKPQGPPVEVRLAQSPTCSAVLIPAFTDWQHIDPRRALSVDQLFELQGEYEEGLKSVKKVGTVLFYITSYTHPMTCLRHSQDCYGLLTSGRCGKCKEDGLRGIPCFKMGMQIADLDSNNAMQIYGWDKIGSCIFGNKTPTAVSKMKDEDIAEAFESWLWPQPLVAKYIIEAKENPLTNYRRVMLTFFNLQKADVMTKEEASCSIDTPAAPGDGNVD